MLSAKRFCVGLAVWGVVGWMAWGEPARVGEPYELLGKRLVFTNWTYVRPGDVGWQDREGASVFAFTAKTSSNPMSPYASVRDVPSPSMSWVQSSSRRQKTQSRSPISIISTLPTWSWRVQDEQVWSSWVMSEAQSPMSLPKMPAQ